MGLVGSVSRVNVVRVVPNLLADMGYARQSLQERERGAGDGAGLLMVVVRKSRVQIDEMKSAEMSKSYRRVPANATCYPNRPTTVLKSGNMHLA